MISLNGNYFSLKHTTTNQCWHISYVIFAMIVVSIISIASISCSADEDYDVLNFKNEQFTRADLMVNNRVEGNTTDQYISKRRSMVFYYPFQYNLIDSTLLNDTIKNLCSFNIQTYDFEAFHFYNLHSHNNLKYIMCNVIKHGMVDSSYIFRYQTLIEIKMGNHQIQAMNETIYDTIPKSDFVHYH